MGALSLEGGGPLVLSRVIHNALMHFAGTHVAALVLFVVAHGTALMRFVGAQAAALVQRSFDGVVRKWNYWCLEPGKRGRGQEDRKIEAKVNWRRQRRVATRISLAQRNGHRSGVWQLALGLLSEMNVDSGDWQLAWSCSAEWTLTPAAASGNSHWACAAE